MERIPVMEASSGETVEGEFVATGYLPSFLDQFIAHGLVREGAVL